MATASGAYTSQALTLLMLASEISKDSNENVKNAEDAVENYLDASSTRRQLTKLGLSFNLEGLMTEELILPKRFSN